VLRRRIPSASQPGRARQGRGTTYPQCAQRAVNRDPKFVGIPPRRPLHLLTGSTPPATTIALGSQPDGPPRPPRARREPGDLPAVIDRLPPQSLEAEQSVLGSILIDRDVIVEVAEFLRPDDFYRHANGLIFAAMLELFERREPVDIVTVAEVLDRNGQLDEIGGRTYLSGLSNQTPTAVHATQYGRIVERKAVLRNLISAAGKIAGIGYEDPAEVQEAIDRAEAELFGVSKHRVDVGFSRLKDLLHAAYDRLDYLHAHRGEISGVSTGFKDLDTLTTGFQKSDLVVLAARPSVGKTSLALNIAEHAAVRDKRTVGVFSLEMS